MMSSLGSLRLMTSQPNLTEPNRTCKTWPQHRETDPLTPLFRGGQVRFGASKEEQ
jgi:hypothetical protein